MANEDVINDLIWIDDAFSKDYVDELEAACCLTDGQNRVYFGDKVSGYFINYQVDPNLRRNYRVITTWNFPYRCLFDFIDRAIAKNLQNFRRGFLLEKCKESFLTMSFVEQKRFMADYYHISNTLSLAVSNEDVIDDGKPEPLLDEYPWVASAKKIYYELELDKSQLHIEQRAKKIEDEMNKRLSKGEKVMAKKGGRKAPTASTILRHALMGL